MKKTSLVAGQGVVHFASNAAPTKRLNKQYAVKFFVSRTTFQAEIDLYFVPKLAGFLPRLDEVQDNDNGQWLDPLGRCVCILQPVLLFSKINKILFGYFDPENIFIDNENK